MAKQLIGITTPDKNISYYYDGLGKRICKEINGVKTYYMYDSEDVLFTLDSSLNPIAGYVHGPSVDEPIQIDQGGASYNVTKHIGAELYIPDDTLYDTVDLIGRRLKNENWNSLPPIVL